jgi:hypothetical protein
MKSHSILYLAVALVSASVNAEVYKCGNGAKAVYQQHPCENAPNKPPMKIKDISKERQLEAQKETEAHLAEDEQRRKTEQAERDKERALQIEEAKAKELRRQTDAIMEQTEALRNPPLPNTYTTPYMPFYRYPYDQHDIPRRRYDDWSGQKHGYPHEQWDGHQHGHRHEQRDKREQPNSNEQWWINPKHDMNDQWWMKKRR